jgi:ATP-dependent Clp protease protease subunit
MNQNDARNLFSSQQSSSSLSKSAFADLRPKEISRLMTMFKNLNTKGYSGKLNKEDNSTLQHFDVYSPFRSLANFASGDYSLKELNPLMNNPKLLSLFKTLQGINPQTSKSQNALYNSVLTELSDQNFTNKLKNQNAFENSSEKALGQRFLRKQYMQDALVSSPYGRNLGENYKYSNYLDTQASADSYNEFRDYYRKQTEKALQEEESKKVFVIINSFGGSVGNGITVHDALQFIKAGSLTLGLGVAASAASLALAGGTIGERYVTEGCHVMIHQPEGGLQGQASDIWIDSQEIMKIRLDVAEIYSLSTYRPKHKILRDLDRDFYLTATETIYYGLADEIATNEVMHSIIEMTSKVWDYHDSKQQRLLESRESASSGLDTQTQN